MPFLSLRRAYASNARLTPRLLGPASDLRGYSILNPRPDPAGPQAWPCGSAIHATCLVIEEICDSIFCQIGS